MQPAANDPVSPAPIQELIDGPSASIRSVLKWILPGVALTTFLLCYAVLGAAEEYRGKVVHIADGDTVTVLVDERRQIKVRISGIDAPEKSQPFGQRAKESLASMFGGRYVVVDTHKRDRYGRQIGSVTVDGHDVGLVQVERGLAWHYKRYEAEQAPEDRAKYAAAEDRARNEKRGLWRERNPTPPWEWRKSR